MHTFLSKECNLATLQGLHNGPFYSQGSIFYQVVCFLLDLANITVWSLMLLYQKTDKPPWYVNQNKKEMQIPCLLAMTLLTLMENTSKFYEQQLMHSIRFYQCHIYKPLSRWSYMHMKFEIFKLCNLNRAWHILHPSN